MITADGKTADAVCASDNANNLRFENRMSIRRFERYREIAVPESAARKTAPLVFAGNVKITAMEIDTDVKGRCGTNTPWTCRPDIRRWRTWIRRADF